MLNQVVLVGRLANDIEIEKAVNGQEYTFISLAVQRGFKNNDGVYETDFIRCALWNGIASNTKNYCHKGDLVGIKGRLQTRNYVDAEGKKKYITEVIVEKISFIMHSSKGKEEKVIEMSNE